MVDTVETKNKFAVQGKTKLISGTITMPQGSGLRLVLVAASESGKPDSELYTVLDKKWRAAKVEAKGWYQSRANYKLGAVKDVATQSDVWLMNMLVLDKDNVLNDAALLTALKEVAKVALYERASVHCSTLLTTDFPQLQELLMTNLVAKGVSVFFYEEPKNK
jgi:hypothetical protein